MKLLVPTDFSKNAQKAVDYAIKMADKARAEIILLHAHQIIDTDSASRKLLFEEYNLSVARKLHDELKIQRGRIARINPGIKVTGELSADAAKKSIVEASIGKDLIVMGTQGASGLKRIFMGSTSASVIGNATVPVLAIPRSYTWKEPKNILLTTNQFETDQTLLNGLFRIVQLFNSRLHVIVFTDSDTATTDDYISHKRSLDNYQNVLEDKYKDITITSAHLKGSEFEDTVQQYVNDHSIDMIAMITYKKNFLENIFHRSATKKMAYRSSIPLLAIPGTGE